MARPKSSVLSVLALAAIFVGIPWATLAYQAALRADTRNPVSLTPGHGQVIFIREGRNQAAPGDMLIVDRGTRDGLQAGEQVVTAANFLIDAESNLKAALASLAAPPTDGEGGR